MNENALRGITTYRFNIGWIHRQRQTDRWMDGWTDGWLDNDE